MRGAQRRGAVEQRRDRLPGEPIVRRAIGFARHPIALQRFQTHQLDHGAVPVERRAGLVAFLRAL
jgi:hypothetical protein